MPDEVDKCPYCEGTYPHQGPAGCIIVVGYGPWKLSENVQTYDRVAYAGYLSHPTCSTSGCDWKVWYKNTLMDNAFPEHYRKYCCDCAFWLYVHVQDATVHRGIVVAEGINRTRYVLDRDEPMKDRGTADFLGHGGRVFRIKFLTGTEVRTNDLWCSGVIPKRWWDMFPVNATLTTE